MREVPRVIIPTGRTKRCASLQGPFNGDAVLVTGNPWHAGEAEFGQGKRECSARCEAQPWHGALLAFFKLVLRVRCTLVTPSPIWCSHPCYPPSLCPASPTKNTDLVQQSPSIAESLCTMHAGTPDLLHLDVLRNFGQPVACHKRRFTVLQSRPCVARSFISKPSISKPAIKQNDREFSCLSFHLSSR
jgi:hypothetical protein